MDDVEELVARSASGDSAAWQELQTLLQPTILAIARRHPELRAKGLAQLADDLAEIATETVTRLAHSDFQNLKHFLERRAAGGPERRNSFDSWLYGAVDFSIREHLRRRFGRAPSRREGAPTRVQLSKREVHSQAGRLDDLDDARSFLRTVGMTAKLTFTEIFAYIEREFGADESRALRLYYAEDQSFEGIAEALGLPTTKDAERMIRRLNGRLRHHFVESKAVAKVAKD